MPAVNRAVVKERALRLRNKGDAALHRHLSGQLGSILDVVVEGENMGRARDFTGVRLTGQVAGLRLNARVTGHDQRVLVGEVAE